MRLSADNKSTCWPKMECVNSIIPETGYNSRVINET
jgi:hypothetical protein